MKNDIQEDYVDPREKAKRIVFPLLILSLAFIISGTSYALWELTFTQTSTNVITSGCFKMSFKDDNPIDLQDAIPITDNAALSLTPYEFTLENTCDSYVGYQINLEILNSSSFTSTNNIKLKLQNYEPKILTANKTVEATLSDASTSYKLETGYMGKNEIITFNLRLWLDEDTPLNEETMNKSFLSKITVITTHHSQEPSFVERVIACTDNGRDSASCMLENSKYDTVNLINDNTIDNNLRYIGQTPNNYVEFNNEKWRIIGVMNNVLDINGNKASRIKLIRDESIGSYSWNSSINTVNSGHGVNEWSQASIMKLLNPGYETEAVGGSLYWDSKSGMCFNEQSQAMTNCDFTTNGLKDKYKEKIENVIWNTGSNGRTYTNTNIDVSEYYTLERSSDVGKTCGYGSTCNDNVTRTTTWSGKVGLMYPSDYGFATKGGTTSTRDICLKTKLYNWNNAEVSDCKTNNWLNKSGSLTMTPLSIPDSSAHSSALLEEGQVGWTAATPYGVYPVVYLKSNVKIIGGKGTETNPIQLDI